MSERLKKALSYFVDLKVSLPTWVWILSLITIYYLSKKYFQEEYHALWAISSLISTLVYGLFFFAIKYIDKISRDETISPLIRSSLIKTFFWCMFGIFIFSLVAMMPSLIYLIKEKTDLELGFLLALSTRKLWIYVSSLSLVAIPVLFGVIDLKILRNVIQLKEEFKSYVIYSDLPIFCTMLAIFMLHFLPLQNLEIFSAGASSFQLIGYNVIFTITGIYTYLERE